MILPGGILIDTQGGYVLFCFFLEIHFVVVSATAIVHSHRVQGSISIHGDDV